MTRSSSTNETSQLHAGMLQPKSVARIDSHELLQGGRRLVIVHRGEEYLLQVTRAGRLILTK